MSRRKNDYVPLQTWDKAEGGSSEEEYITRKPSKVHMPPITILKTNIDQLIAVCKDFKFTDYTIEETPIGIKLFCKNQYDFDTVCLKLANKFEFFIYTSNNDSRDKALLFGLNKDDPILVKARLIDMGLKCIDVKLMQKPGLNKLDHIIYVVYFERQSLAMNKVRRNRTIFSNLKFKWGFECNNSTKFTHFGAKPARDHSTEKCNATSYKYVNSSLGHQTMYKNCRSRKSYLGVRLRKLLPQRKDCGPNEPRFADCDNSYSNSLNQQEVAGKPNSQSQFSYEPLTNEDFELVDAVKMATVTNWEKFRLLLWKNWILQWNFKWSLAAEVLLPPIFVILLVLIRALVTVDTKPMKTFKEVDISTLDLFKPSMERAAMFSKMYRMSRRHLPVDDVDPYPAFSLYYSPKNPLLEKIIDEVALKLGLSDCAGFENARALEAALMKVNVLGGIEFDDSLANITSYPKKLSYAVRFPSELRTGIKGIGMNWMTMRLFEGYSLPGPRNIGDNDGGIPVGYLREGFLPVQHAVSTAFLKIASGTETLPEVVMQRYPYPSYIFDPLIQGLPSMMAFMILLSFIYPVSQLTKSITMEKEKQLKEIMKIMGLQNWIHWSAWFFKAFLMWGVSALIISGLLKISIRDDVSILTNSSYTLVLFFLFIYVVTSICFCFMTAVFFSKSNTAAAVSGLLWFIFYIPFSFSANTYDELSLASKLFYCLFGNSAMGLGFTVILGFEGTGEGIHWYNLFTPYSVDDNFTLGGCMGMMILSCFIYMTVCLYIEQVFPGEYGVPKVWYFPFTKSYWCGGNKIDFAEKRPNTVSGLNLRNAAAFEMEPLDKHVGLRVQRLRKTFGDKAAVKDLSINMYEDEITVLLGHNGAGKTTTISMLTGMFPPTSGTAIINGYDIRTNTEDARASMGICPQHNVLFDNMSVSNHIVFFSRLKGVRGDAVQDEVQKYLKMIELENKADIASSKLSGGMKRKLSVCCALCGGTKVVLCDEPSSGMDPAARRQLWDLLQAEKTGRTLLLTTHFMDEADVLGDRIAIMCGGELKCHGTPFFLKKKFGSGYRLICVKRENCKVPEITELLSQFISDIEPESDIGAELTYQLPDNYSSLFEDMFGSLEEKSNELNLSGYGIGITSMEEVFMKVGAENASTALNGDKLENGNGVAEAIKDVESVHSNSIFTDTAQLLTGNRLCVNQWKAMFLKKLLYTWRNKIAFILQNFLAIFFVIITIIIANAQGTFVPLKQMTFDLKQYPSVVTILETTNKVQENSLEGNISSYYSSIVESYGSKYPLEKTGDSSFSDYVLELGETIQVRINSRYLAAATVTVGKITAWLNNQPLHTVPLTVNLVHNALAKALLGDDAEIIVTNSPLPYSTKTKLKQLNLGNNLGTQLATNICFAMCFVSAFYILFPIKERVSRSKLLQFVGGVKVWTFWLSQYFWDLATFIFTALLVVLTIACFQEEGFSKFSELGRYFLLIIIFGFAVLPFTYIISLTVDEPATGFSRISIINIFAGMALFVVITVMSFEFFSTKDLAKTLQWIFRLFPHFSLASSINKLFSNTATRNACEASSETGISEDEICLMLPQCCHLTSYFGWKEPGILPEIVYMVGTTFLYFLIIISFEYKVVGEVMYKLRNIIMKPPPPLPPTDLDDDVERERKRILAMSSNEIATQNLVLDRVTKYYDKFLAVDQVSLCVQKAECFGLLGVNGAGKTTTFKMMTGDERITYGVAYVKGMNLKMEMNTVYREIGYCPQFDALLDDITGRETLKIFALLRGIPKDRINELSEKLAKAFGFMKHMDKMTRAYSGGNKRKLSTAIAVIGSPSVIYLDEPTTGMDPAARRQLWNMVCYIRDSGKSIVLTSHSMEECEALCTRLAIMVNGEFKCIGSTQHLKNKFSKGIILKIKVRKVRESIRIVVGNETDLTISERPGTAQDADQNITNVKAFIRREFPFSKLQEEYQGILTFYIPLTGVKWSRIFGLMERNRDELNVEDYSISQTTLEEIFLEFAKKQREDKRVFK